MTRMLLGEHPMDLATIFEWFAQESMTAAEQAKVPIEREMWLRLGSLWMAAAQRSHDETVYLSAAYAYARSTCP